MALSDKTKRIILIVVWAAIVLSIILPFVEIKFEGQKAALNTSTIKVLSWAIKITRLLILITMPLWVVLVYYGDWMRTRIDSVQRVTRMKIVASATRWSTIIILILLAMKFSLVLFRGSHDIIFASIKYALISLFLLCFLLYAWDMFRYFHTQPACNIIATSFVEHHDKYVKKKDFNNAYSVLLKACETEPDGVWLWCKLAMFCEQTRKNSAEADIYMAKAGELITTNKANNIRDKACYLNYLGLINYVRGEQDKGLGYIKQALDIESTPYRIKLYEELVEYSKNTQPDTNPPDPKTVT
jgi:hypothetical protein